MYESLTNFSEPFKGMNVMAVLTRKASDKNVSIRQLFMSPQKAKIFNRFVYGDAVLL